MISILLENYNKFLSFSFQIEANYDWEYAVKEHYNDFGHKESRHGYAATGVYYVALPDGRFQTVRYTADKHGRIRLFITSNRKILNSLLHIFQDSIPKLSTTEVQVTLKKSLLTENQATPQLKEFKKYQFLATEMASL